jgi:hypothetical protein
VKAKNRPRDTRKTTAVVPKTTRTKRRKKKKRACPADRPARLRDLQSRRVRTSNRIRPTNVYL